MRVQGPRSGLARWLLLLAALLLGGCTTMEPRPLDAALFPPLAAGVSALHDGAAIALSMADPDQGYASPPIRLRHLQVQLPIGRIVEAAARLALGEQFGSVEVGPPAPGALAVRIADVAPELDSALIYFVPVPGGIIDRVDVTTRLAFRLAVVAPDGRVRWSQAYDSGRERVEPRRKSFLEWERLPDAIQRLFHEQAVGLMRQAAADLRSWLAQERRRERVL